ncbi:MAG: OmpH family outer membrane protein [Proteiniphilum sp.]|nr:OmpH family outer membrane protein [Proteiniphilum sp.]
MTKFKLIFISALLFISSVVAAQDFIQNQNQTITIAYVNSIELLEGFKEKEEASEKILSLSDNYKKELEIMQNEYNKKYSDYITYQNSLTDNIKLRRMQELTELENRIQQFMKLAQEDIEQQEQLMLNPLKERVMNAIKQVGIENNFTVVYDLADPSIAFINPNAVDANALVKRKLGH